MRYESILKIHLLPRWGEVPVDSTKRGVVGAWVADLRDSGVLPGTIQKVYTTFRAALSYAVFNYRLPRNPAQGLKLPPRFRVTTSKSRC